MLYISTSIWVLHTPYADQNMLSQHLFCTNSIEKAYFDQGLECAAPNAGRNIQQTRELIKTVSNMQYWTSAFS